MTLLKYLDNKITIKHCPRTTNYFRLPIFLQKKINNFRSSFNFLFSLGWRDSLWWPAWSFRKGIWAQALGIIVVVLEKYFEIICVVVQSKCFPIQFIRRASIDHGLNEFYLEYSSIPRIHYSVCMPCLHWIDMCITKWFPNGLVV